MGKGLFYRPMIDLSLLVSLCLWTVNFTSVCKYFFSPLKWDRMARLNFPFPGQLVSDNSLEGQRPINQFPQKENLVKQNRIECSGCFRIIIFPPILMGSKRGFFSNIYCGKLINLLQVNLRIQQGCHMTGPSVVFNSDLSTLSLQ